MCSDGSCISDRLLCDGETQCKNQEDEKQCWCLNGKERIYNSTFCRHQCHKDNCQCPPMYYQCANGGCVQYSLVCDGLWHCKDGSDEDCIVDSKKTLEKMFKCNNNKTIDMILVNDLVPDCQT